MLEKLLGIRTQGLKAAKERKLFFSKWPAQPSSIRKPVLGSIATPVTCGNTA